MRNILLTVLSLLPLCSFAQEVRYFDKFFIMTDKNKTDHERRYVIDPATRTVHFEDYALFIKQASGTISGLTSPEAANDFIKYARNEASPFHFKPEFEYVGGEFTKYKKDGTPDAHFFVKRKKVLYGQVWDDAWNPRLVEGTGLYDREGDAGRSRYVEAFVDSLLDSRYKIRLSEGDTIFSKVDKPAEPKEGMQKFYSLLVKRMRYPVFAHLAGKEGVVLLNFVVDKNGELTEFKPLTPDGSTFEKKVMQKFEDLPPWQPAVFKGKNVKVEYTLPVRFKLQ